MLLNGSQIFVEVLCEQGVDTIFVTDLRSI